jgi:hypothetical protein
VACWYGWLLFSRGIDRTASQRMTSWCGDTYARSPDGAKRLLWWMVGKRPGLESKKGPFHKRIQLACSFYSALSKECCLALICDTREWKLRFWALVNTLVHCLSNFFSVEEPQISLFLSRRSPACKKNCEETVAGARRWLKYVFSIAGQKFSWYYEVYL